MKSFREAMKAAELMAVAWFAQGASYKQVRLQVTRYLRANNGQGHDQAFYNAKLVCERATGHIL